MAAVFVSLHLSVLGAQCEVLYIVSLDRTHVTETAQCCLTFRTRFLVAGVIKEVVSWL